MTDQELTSELVNSIATLAQNAVGAEGKVAVIALPDEQPGTYGVVTADGKLDIRQAANPPRQHTLKSVDQVGNFVGDAVSRLKTATTVWYDQTGVVILLDDKALDLDKRAFAKVPLKHSPEFSVLQAEARNPANRVPREFINWLRRHLLDALEDAEDLLPMLRNLKFSESGSGHAKNSMGRESIGREVDQEVTTDAGDLPDMVTCNVRVFDDPAIQRRIPVRCVLEVNPRSGEFTLTPLTVDLLKAVDEELANIGELLQKAVQCPVFYGQP